MPPAAAVFAHGAYLIHMTASPVSIRILTNPADPAVTRITGIYLQAIPETERKPAAWLTEVITRKGFTLLVAIEAESPVGFATIFVPPDRGFSLLEYLAVDPNYRSRGIGAELFHASIVLANSSPMLLEVDSADRFSLSHDERARRIAFYRRLGCRRIADLSYILPMGNAPPMELMVANAPGNITTIQLRQWLQTIYRDVYSVPPSDPRIAKMIETIQTDKVELV